MEIILKIIYSCVWGVIKIKIFEPINFPGIGYPIICGFTNRNGGNSEGIFNSLNLGLSTNDPFLSQNLQLVSNALSVSKDQWAWLEQVHGSTVKLVLTPGNQGSGDGLYTQQPKINLMVQTADCVPILFAHKNIPFVSAIHAGWKGLKNNIIDQFIKITRSISLNPEDLFIAIGPHLKVCHFEVTSEFLSNFDSSYFSESDGIFYFNPTKYIMDQLIRHGLDRKKIFKSENCTFCNNSYFSYRQQNETGRQIGFIGILNNK